MSRGTIQFVGLSGYGYPHTRVRCYRFAEVLSRHGYHTRVFSFHDRLAPGVSEADMYGLGDVERLRLVLAGAIRLAIRPHSLLYVQKIHYHALSALLVHRMWGTPYVLDYDDWEVGLDPYGIPLFCGFRNPRVTRALFGSYDPERILRLVARRACLTVCASKFLETRLSEFASPVVYAPTGVDTSRFGGHRTPHDDVVILWNGVIWGEAIRDNVVLLLRALLCLRNAGVLARLRIVGQGAYLDEVRRIAAELGVDSSVEFPGWISPDCMPDQLAGADIGVLPLTHGDHWTRGKSPTKLFEYMASGLAVLVMNEGEASHVIDHGVNGLIATDEADFVRQLRRLVESESLRSQLGSAARTRVESAYSLDVIGGVLAQTLRRHWR